MRGEVKTRKMTKLGETENCEVKQFHEAGNNETRPHSVRLMKWSVSASSLTFISVTGFTQLDSRTFLYNTIDKKPV